MTERRQLALLHTAARKVAIFAADDDNRRSWLESQFGVRSFKALKPRESNLCYDLLRALARGDSISRFQAQADTRSGRGQPSQARLDYALGLAIQCFAPATADRLAGLVRKFTAGRTADLRRVAPAEYHQIIAALRASLGLIRVRPASGLPCPASGLARPGRPRTAASRDPARRTGGLATDRPSRRRPRLTDTIHVPGKENSA